MATISHYEILEKLGEGGMGVVWKARDTRLERFVALKLLPAEKTADPARRQRFAQEARAASALNHPNIVTIYDIDRASHEGETVDFIAMEYVAGRTLDQLIPKKGLRVSEALKYAIQIAEALACAHAAGIVHRDLKPGNVVVSDKGVVKVLDFGLAKLVEPSGIAESDHTRTIAVDGPKTEEGTILGTAAYMSPEQAEGKKVDARSDIFSFGALLYEMLTGRRAFQGDSKMATLAAILNRDPEPLESQAEGIPRELSRIVQRCLRKEVERRAHSMQDLKLALEELKEDSESSLTQTTQSKAPVPAVRSKRGMMLAGALAVAIVGAGTAAWMSRGTKTAEAQLQAVPLTAYAGFETSPAFSPDGNQMAFTWDDGKTGENDVYLKLIGPDKPLRLTTGAKVSGRIHWSPDGRALAFTRNRGGQRSVVLMPALGGAEREVGGAGITVTGWSPDGRWLLISAEEAKGKGYAIFLLSVADGQRKRLTTPAPGTEDDAAALSPDGRSLAVIRRQGVSTLRVNDLYVISLTSDLAPKGDGRRITNDQRFISGLAWTADSAEIVYASTVGGTPALYRVNPSGTEKGRRLTVGEGASSVGISRRGDRLAYTQVIPSDQNVWRFDLKDPTARPVSFIDSTRAETSAEYSPDGKKIAFRSNRSGIDEIWACDADGQNASQLTTRGYYAGSPRWSADSSRIVFDSNVNGTWQVFVVSAQGGQSQQLTSGTGNSVRPAWSRDGKWIYFSSGEMIWKMPSGGGSPVQVEKLRGYNPVELEDGSVFSYWRGTVMKAAADGSVSTVLEGLADQTGVNSIPTREGIYYRPKAAPREIRFHDFATGKSRVVLTGDKPEAPGLSISPDGRWLLYVQIDRSAGSDLMLVENFR